MVRYKLKIHTFILFNSNPNKSMTVGTTKFSVSNMEPIFVDILERDGDYANMRIYTPNQVIKLSTGWQDPSLVLTLHYFGEDIFDGRFNYSRKE